MISTRLAVVVTLAVPLSGLSVSACGGGQKDAVGDSKVPGAARPEALHHEDCSESGNRVELLDTNGDGKPDIHRVFDKGSGREICRIVDLDHDGKPDLYEYYDASGTIRRREYCYDETGSVNAIEYFENGKLARREYDTSGQHKIDTWDWFDGSAPVDAKTGRPTHPSRRERDVTGDGKVDQWWTWNGDSVSIAVDNNGDGKPDPGSTLKLDKNGQPIDNGGGDDGSGAPPPASSASSAPSGANADGGAPASSGAPASGAAPAASSAPSGDGGKP